MDHVGSLKLLVEIQLLKIINLYLLEGVIIEIHCVNIGYMDVQIQVLTIIIEGQKEMMDHVLIHLLQDQMMTMMMKMDVLWEQPVL